MPDSNFIFFVATKKTKQKKALRCAGHVWLVKAATSIRNVLVEQNPTFPPQVTRLLRASNSVEGRYGHHCFGLFPCRLHCKGGAPVTGRRIRAASFLDVSENRQRRCPPQGEGTFCILLLPDKSMASGGTQPAGSAFKKIEKATDEPSVALNFRETPSASGNNKPRIKCRVCQQSGRDSHYRLTPLYRQLNASPRHANLLFVHFSGNLGALFSQIDKNRH